MSQELQHRAVSGASSTASFLHELLRVNWMLSSHQPVSCSAQGCLNEGGLLLEVAMSISGMYETMGPVS